MEDSREFALSFVCDGAAFDDDNLNGEAARILLALAQKVNRGEVRDGEPVRLYDDNGNFVGAAGFAVAKVPAKVRYGLTPSGFEVVS